MEETETRPKKEPKPRGGAREGAGRRRKWVQAPIQHTDYWVLATMASKNSTSIEREAGRWLAEMAEQCRSEAAAWRSQDYHAEKIAEVATAKGTGEVRRLSKEAGVSIRKVRPHG